MVLLVTFDLKAPAQRSRFLGALDLMGRCCRVNDSKFLITTNRSHSSVADELFQYCTSGDTFSVDRLDSSNIGTLAGTLPRHAERWLSGLACR